MIRKEVLLLKKIASKEQKKGPHLLAVFAIVGTHETTCLNQPKVLDMQKY